MRVSALVSFIALVALVACGSSGTPPAPAPAPAVAPPVGPPSAPTPPAIDPNADGPNGRASDICGQILVVAWRGADHAPEGVTRSEADAHTRADALRTRIAGGEAFDTVASAESDAPTTRAHGGILGSFSPGEWPPLHAPLLPVIQALGVGQLGEVTRLPYGYVVPRRCEVHKLHVAHILVRFHGARNADASVTRTENEAHAAADQIHAELVAGADFATTARAKSEDGSAARGGDLGWVAMGLLQPEFERNAVQLQPGQLSGVIQTAFGFHVIKRLE